MNKRMDLGHGCYMELASKAELVCPGSGDRVTLTPTEYKILCYLVEQANLAVYLESIARDLWGANFDADNRDPESIKSHITRIRNKLGKLCPELKESLETNYGYGSYTYKLKTKDPISKKDPTSPASPENMGLDEAMRLCDQVDALVCELEVIRQKCNEAAHQGGLWEKIYERQFEAVNYKLECIFEELQKKRSQAEEIRHRAVRIDELKRNSDAPLPGGFSFSLVQTPVVEEALRDEARLLEVELSDIRTRMNAISGEIDFTVKDLEMKGNEIIEIT